jgi:hypothetical protein
MGSNIEANGSFVRKWLTARLDEGELDKEILNLISENLQGSSQDDMDESGLLSDLKQMADKVGEEKKND